MSGFLQDARYAVRQLRKNNGFTAVAVITLALGIGANTAIYSIVNAVLLRPLPFLQPSRLALLHEGLPTVGFPRIGFSAPDLTMYQRAEKSFEGVAGYQSKDFELSGAGEPERLTSARVTANLFSVLGVAPALGRAFRAEEDRPGQHVALLSYRLWQSKFSGASDVVGRTVDLDRAPYTIVGVMPRGFQFPLRGNAREQPAALWVPMAFTQDELQGWGNMFNSTVIGRLKPGVSLEQAQSEATVLAQHILKAYPPALVQQFGVSVLTMEVGPMQREVVGEVRPLLLVLQATVGLVLLIACVNVGLLLLARASTRGQEIALRTALGASRGRLLAQLLTESLALAVPSGVLGLGLAIWSKGLLLKYVPAEIALPRQVPLDSNVLVVTAVITLLTALLCGLAPALVATRFDLRATLQEGGRGGTVGRRRHRIQGSFVAVEFALALILMVGAGLLLRSSAKLLEANTGFRPESVLAMSVPLPVQAYLHAAEIRNYYQQAIARLAEQPGVVSVAAATDLPLKGNDLEAIAIDNQADSVGSHAPAIRTTWVLGDYLQAMGIPVLRGRRITPGDRQGTQPIVLVSDRLASQLWPNEDAVGKRVFIHGSWWTVVGIVGDVHDAALSAPPSPHMYLSYLQQPDSAVENNVVSLLRSLNVVIRAKGDPGALGTTAVAALHQLDPALAVVDVHTMQTEVKDSIAPQRFNATMVGIYAGLALLLATVGIYGVLAYMVVQQTHEIGIRLALGAQPSDMLALVLLRGVRLALIGAAVGLPTAWAVGRLMASLLYGVTPRDPATFFGVTLLLGAAAVLACYVPALRAAKVDLMVALRYE
jgi:predicted permease